MLHSCIITSKSLTFLLAAGYWGSSATIVLTHAHGPKPERCLDCYVLARDEWRLDRIKEDCPCYHVYADIYMMAPDEGR